MYLKWVFLMKNVQGLKIQKIPLESAFSYCILVPKFKKISGGSAPLTPCRGTAPNPAGGCAPKPLPPAKDGALHRLLQALLPQIWTGCRHSVALSKHVCCFHSCLCLNTPHFVSFHKLLLSCGSLVSLALSVSLSLSLPSLLVTIH